VDGATGHTTRESRWVGMTPPPFAGGPPVVLPPLPGIARHGGAAQLSHVHVHAHVHVGCTAVECS
jgi:hypothetical protein